MGKCQKRKQFCDKFFWNRKMSMYSMGNVLVWFIQLGSNLCCPLHFPPGSFLQLFTQHVHEDSQCIQIFSCALDENFKHTIDTPRSPKGRRGSWCPLRTKKLDSLSHIFLLQCSSERGMIWHSVCALVNG